MRHAVAALVLVNLGFSEADARTYAIHVKAGNGQLERWVNGVQWVQNTQRLSAIQTGSIVADLPDHQSNFKIVILNRSTIPVTVGPENIHITFGGGKIIQPIEAGVLEGRLRRDIKRRSALLNIGTAFSAAGANGQASSSFSYQGMAGGTSYTGSGIVTSYDPALAAQQQAQVVEQAREGRNAIAGRGEVGVEALSGLFRTTTIAPGQTAGGIIAFDAPDLGKGSSDATIEVDVGSEKHILLALIEPALK